MANEPIIYIEGNVARDPQLKQLEGSGKPVLDLSVLQTPSRKRGDEWEDLPTLAYDLTVWGPVAEHVARSLPKGTAVVARGRVRGVRTYESRGEIRVVTLVDVDSIGPSLKHATAEVVRRGPGQSPSPFQARPQGGQQQPSSDPWGAATGGGWPTATPGGA